MGKQIITQSLIHDDLSGVELPEDTPETVLYWDGRMVSLYLGTASLEKLGKALAPFFAKGEVTEGVSASFRRPTSGGNPSGNTSTNAFPELADVDPAEIREWANKTGRKVSDKGRISNEVLSAYVQEVIRPDSTTDDTNAA